MRRKGIEETDKSFVFYREIGKEPVTVSLRCGWIWIEEMDYVAHWYGSSRRKITRTFTTEDARNLIAAIQELVPREEKSAAMSQEDIIANYEAGKHTAQRNG